MELTIEFAVLSIRSHQGFFDINPHDKEEGPIFK